MTPGVRLCHIDEVPEAGARGFDPLLEGQTSLFVVRRGEELFAYRDQCPHEGAHLAWRKDAYLNRAGDRIVCHAHGAQFEIHSGQCLLGPCLGQTLQGLPLHVGKNGDVYLLSENDYGVK